MADLEAQLQSAQQGLIAALTQGGPWVEVTTILDNVEAQLAFAHDPAAGLSLGELKRNEQTLRLELGQLQTRCERADLAQIQTETAAVREQLAALPMELDELHNSMRRLWDDLKELETQQQAAFQAQQQATQKLQQLETEAHTLHTFQTQLDQQAQQWASRRQLHQQRQTCLVLAQQILALQQTL